MQCFRFLLFCFTIQVKIIAIFFSVVILLYFFVLQFFFYSGSGLLRLHFRQRENRNIILGALAIIIRSIRL